jgi:hypothetical protein
MATKSREIGSISAIAAALLAGGYYLASPYLAVKGASEGFASRNAAQVNKYIDYPALQSSLKSQLGAIMLESMRNDPEMAANPFSGFAAAMITPIVNTMVDTYVTPTGMKLVLDSAKQDQGGATKDQTTLNLAEKSKEFNEALKKTSMGYKDLGNFQLTAKGDDGKQIQILLDRRGFSDWKINAVVLPKL